MPLPSICDIIIKVKEQRFLYMEAQAMLSVESLTIEEIRERYPNEWILVEYEEIDSEFNIIKGHVITHSPVLVQR